ncbi:MAG: FeoB-associated Cys-rich membrane protein [Oscillospiraceae bacterium]|nr:FeoB-associated Cys-rich membrane protein [Oscillospiraceae bacterium]
MNGPTLIVLAVVVAIVAAIVIAHIRRKKRGEASCSCGGCSSCPMHGSCRH